MHTIKPSRAVVGTTQCVRDWASKATLSDCSLLRYLPASTSATAGFRASSALLMADAGSDVFFDAEEEFPVDSLDQCSLVENLAVDEGIDFTLDIGNCP